MSILFKGIDVHLPDFLFLLRFAGCSLNGCKMGPDTEGENCWQKAAMCWTPRDQTPMPMELLVFQASACKTNIYKLGFHEH